MAKNTQQATLINAYKGQAGLWLYEGFTAEQWRDLACDMAERGAAAQLIEKAFTIAKTLSCRDVQ